MNLWWIYCEFDSPFPIVKTQRIIETPTDDYQNACEVFFKSVVDEIPDYKDDFQFTNLMVLRDGENGVLIVKEQMWASLYVDGDLRNRVPYLPSPSEQN